jgi:hypothetical protein
MLILNQLMEFYYKQPKYARVVIWTAFMCMCVTSILANSIEIGEHLHGALCDDHELDLTHV